MTSFAQRLTQACNDNRDVPEHGRGRQVAIANRLKVTQEAVRKWFAGESVPRRAKMTSLAEYLGVEETWLALGVKPELDRAERKQALRQTHDAVNLVAGLIMMEGGNCAFPRENDPRAGYVDLYTIMRGSQYSLHVAVARAKDEGGYEITVPREYEDVKCIGVIQTGVGKFHFVELPTEQITKHKSPRAGDFVIEMEVVNTGKHQYHTAGDVWPRFNTFGELK